MFCAPSIFFTWGEIFSLFPSTCTDVFGMRYATANASLLYTAKGTSAWLVPLANVLKDATGSWYAVFAVCAVGNYLVFAAALFLVRPLREAHHRKRAAAASARRDRRWLRPKPRGFRRKTMRTWTSCGQGRGCATLDRLQSRPRRVHRRSPHGHAIAPVCCGKGCGSRAPAQHRDHE